MFLNINKKNNVYPYKPQFYYIKVGFKRVKFYRHVFVMIWVDTGVNGSASDAAIFNQSELTEVIENGIIGFAAEDPLPNDDRSIPYFYHRI